MKTQSTKKMEVMKMLTKKIVKKGNSNFVLIPMEFLANLDLETGDKIDIRLEDSKIVIIPNKKEEKRNS